MWFKRTSERIRAPYIQQLWLVVESDLVKPTARRVALLRQSLQEAIGVYQVDQQLAELKAVEIPARDDLWKRRLTRFPPIAAGESSEIAKRLIS